MSPAGRLLSVTRRLLDRQVPSTADREAFRAVYARTLRNAPADQKEQIMSRLEFAEYRGAFGRFLAAATGELWVGEFGTAEDVTKRADGWHSPDRLIEWSVLGATGEWLADVRLPARFTVLDAGLDYVAGVRRDADDLEEVVVYRLRRSASPSGR